MPLPLSVNTGLGMKVTVLPCLRGHVLDDVLVHQHAVGHFHQFVKSQVDFRLAGGADFVVLTFDIQAAIDQGLHHLVAKIHHLVSRRNREIAFLVPELVAQVGLFVAAAIPFAFDAVDVVEAFVRVLIEADVVEDKEFGFGAQVSRVGDAGRLQVVDRFSGHIPRVARVIFAGDRDLECCRSSPTSATA